MSAGRKASRPWIGPGSAGRGRLFAPWGSLESLPQAPTPTPGLILLDWAHGPYGLATQGGFIRYGSTAFECDLLCILNINMYQSEYTLLRSQNDVLYLMSEPMITARQMRAARALLGLDQGELARLAGVSLPTIQRMEASDGLVRGVVTTLMKVVEAIEAAGVELIRENAPSTGAGRGIRLKDNAPRRAPHHATPERPADDAGDREEN